MKTFLLQSVESVKSVVKKAFAPLGVAAAIGISAFSLQPSAFSQVTDTTYGANQTATLTAKAAVTNTWTSATNAVNPTASTYTLVYNAGAPGYSNSAAASAAGYLTSNGMSGGLLFTNSVKAGQNITALTTPVDLRHFDEAGLYVTGYLPTNAGASLAAQGTQTLSVYPCDDGLNPDTNNPLAAIILTPSLVGGGFTNFLTYTNLARTIIGPHGYISFGLNNAGTNTDTNLLIQIIAKSWRTGSSTSVNYP